MFRRPAPAMVRSGSGPGCSRRWAAECTRIAPVPFIGHRPRGPPDATGPIGRIGPVLRSLPQMIVLVDLNRLMARRQPPVRPIVAPARRRPTARIA